MNDSPEIVTSESLAETFLENFHLFKTNGPVAHYFTTDQVQVMVNTVTLDPIQMVGYVGEIAYFVKEKTMAVSPEYSAEALMHLAPAIAGIYIPALAVLLGQLNGTEDAVEQQLEVYTQRKAIEHGYTDDPLEIGKNLDFDLNWDELGG